MHSVIGRRLPGARTLAAVLVALALLAPATTSASWHPDWGSVWSTWMSYWQSGHHRQPKPRANRIQGTISWGNPIASYAEVDFFDFTAGMYYTADTVHGGVHIDHGTSAHYSIDVADNTNLEVFVTVSTCSDGNVQCGRSVPGTNLRYGAAGINAPHGRFDLDMKIGSHSNPLEQICGEVVVPGLTLNDGTTEFESVQYSDTASFDWVTLVPLSHRGAYCANVIQGYVDQSVTLNLRGCSQTVGGGDVGFINFGLVDHSLYNQEFDVAVSAAKPGTISGSYTGLAAVFPPSDPTTGYFASAFRTEQVTDCQGGTQFGVSNSSPFTLDKPGTTSSLMTPGDWVVAGSVDSGGAASFSYNFFSTDITLAAGKNVNVTFALGPAAVFSGTADLSGWALGPADEADFSGDLATDIGYGTSRATTLDFPNGLLPVKLVADTGASAVSPVEYTASAIYAHDDGTFAFLTILASASVATPLSTGAQAAPGLDVFDVQVGQWTVDGGDAISGFWSGGVGPDYLITADAFGGDTGFHATLAPGFYQGFFDSDGTELDVEMGAGDVEHRNVSGPLVRDIEPQPGPAGANIAVSATIVDADGIASVTINGTAVPVGADGTVKASVPAAAQVTIVATDGLGNQTSHTRNFQVGP